MAEIALILTVVTFAVTYIYDVVDFPHNFVARVLTFILRMGGQRKLPPVQPHNVTLPKIFECSLCATTWLTLIILVILAPWRWWWLCLVCGWATKFALMAINLADQMLTLPFILMERLIHKIKGD